MNICKIDIKNRSNALEVLILQRESYQVEAQLIGSDKIPPLHESLDELMACGEQFLGYYMNGGLAGTISFKFNEPGIMDIHRIIVKPAHFRKGIASALIREVEKSANTLRKITVSTGAANIPAILLYEKLGFERAGDVTVEGGIVISNFVKEII